MREIGIEEILTRIIAPAFLVTIKMLAVSIVLAGIFGMILAIILYMTRPGGMMPNGIIYKLLNTLVSLIRSFPFIILMVSIIPFTRFVTGSSIGWTAAIVPMTVAGTPFLARMFENNLKEVNPALVEAAQAFGASNSKIIFKVIFVEALPALISSSILSVIQLLSLSAVAGTVGAGGLGAAAQTLSKYEIAVSHKAERGVGDVLRLCRSEAYYDVNGGIKQPAPEDVTVLTVAALTDTKPSGWALDIYVSDELYADIIASEPATGIEIALTDPAMNAQVETALRARFAGAEYAVTNRQSGSDFLREMSSGVYLLLGYIFAALFLLILLILYVRLCDYIEGSRPLIRSLHRLGASKRTLYRSYIRQDGISAAAAVAAPFLISLPLTALLCVWQKAPLHLDGGMLAAYAALAALLLFTYWHPVHRSLKRVLRPL